MKTGFNDNSDAFGDYNFSIKAANAQELLFKAGDVKNVVRDWIEEKTGVSPYLVLNDDQTLFLSCRASMAAEICRVFADDISGMTRIKTREEIIREDLKNGGDGDICWRPQGPKK